MQVAHSGSLIGIILDLSEKGAHQKATAIAEAASDIGFKDVEIHRVNEEAGR
ncbi:hypothetical protein GCM10007937_52610 [Mesorhizobium albiziae]|nr:hypothetical protein GCM10007937_52610 [Mesorhizobium albiziae]